MDIYSISGVIAGIIALIGFVPYVRNILLKKTKPQRVTWLIFSILNLAAVGVQVTEGAGWSAVMGIAATVGCIAIFTLSIKSGVGGFATRDIVSLLLAGVGLMLWVIADNPLLALVAIIGANLAGTWLTVRKAYMQPHTETAITWVLAAVSSGLALVAAHTLQTTIVLFPAYLMVANTVIVFAITLGRKKYHVSQEQ